MRTLDLGLVLLLPTTIACGGAGAGADDGLDDEPLAEPTTHFADEPVAWSTPQGDFAGGYFAAGTTAFDAGSWGLHDLDGDGHLDLVRFAPPATAGDSHLTQYGHPSAPRWDVYLGGADGFADEPVAWSTPQGDFAGGYFAAGTTAFDAGSWGLHDLDGDGQPDLVRFAPPATAGDSHLTQLGHPSAPRWDVHLGGADGFADEPVAWSTPQGDFAGGYFAAGTTAFDAGSWGLLDLDGDLRSDLIEFAPAALAGASHLTQLGHPSAPRWDVYRGSVAGVADAALAWATPPAEHGSGFFTSGTTAFDVGSWGLVDLTGDGSPDLVRFAPAASAGASHLTQYGHPSAPRWDVFVARP